MVQIYKEIDRDELRPQARSTWFTWNGKDYYMDSTYVEFCKPPYETEIFPIDPDTEEIDFGNELYCERFQTEEEMFNKHAYILNHIEEILGE